MIVHFFDDMPAKTGEAHGPLGPTHCGRVPVDYEYQAEEWVRGIRDLNPTVVKVELHIGDDITRRWEFKDNKWEELEV